MTFRPKGLLIPLLALFLVAIPCAAQETAQTDTTATVDTTLTDTTFTATSGETAITETTTETVEPTDTASTTTYYEDDDMEEDGDDAAPAACAACAAVTFVVPLVLLGISIAIALWIYRDAKERGITSAPLWVIIGFLFNILGLVIYLIARKGMQPPASPGSMAPPPPPA